jgi:uncharacterized protein (TIGR02145 family)
MKKNHVSLRSLKNVAILISLIISPMVQQAQTKGVFTDVRDGKSYNWVKVGSQTWMAQNLSFNAPSGSWAYNNDTVNLPLYGRLYSWKAAQTACPKGWHVPSDKEWGTLIQALGGNAEAGLKMQSMDTIGRKTTTARPGSPATLSSLLSGVRHPDGSCIGLNFWGGCWSSGKVNDSVANNVLFAHGSKEMVVSSNDMKSGFSVRCVKK